MVTSGVSEMSNMGYCRFRNTLSDLRDCADHFDDDDLLEEERSARAKLVALCSRIAEEHEDDGGE